MICLIQHFEADFLWKVSLKILNSGIILKTFIHAYRVIKGLHCSWEVLTVTAEFIQANLSTIQGLFKNF